MIPVTYKGEPGAYVHSMYLDCEPPIVGGRELWGFPKKLANPRVIVDKETLIGDLHFGPCAWRPPPWATSTRRSTKRP